MNYKKTLLNAIIIPLILFLLLQLLHSLFITYIKPFIHVILDVINDVHDFSLIQLFPYIFLFIFFYRVNCSYYCLQFCHKRVFFKKYTFYCSSNCTF